MPIQLTPLASLCMTTSMPAQDDVPVLFFDGVCGLCNRTVDFVLKHDRRGTIRFAPLQGSTASERLPDEDRQRLDSVILQVGGTIHKKSSAVVRLLRAMGGIWTLLGWLLWLIPRPLRDIGYVLVAMNRYRLFGKKETCRMPKPAERERLWE